MAHEYTPNLANTLAGGDFKKQKAGMHGAFRLLKIVKIYLYAIFMLLPAITF